MFRWIGSPTAVFAFGTGKGIGLEDYWLTIGVVAVIAALTSAVVSIWGVSRNIKHKAVIEERQNWRQAVRELVPSFVSQDDAAEREVTRNAIVLRLNPYKDQEAIDLLTKYTSTPSVELGRTIVAHFQAMLKLEWQRAKKEAGLIPWGAAWRAGLGVRWQRRRAERRNTPMAIASHPDPSSIP